MMGEVISDGREMLRMLCDLSVNGLLPMYDSREKAFCYRVRKTPEGIVSEGTSFRYTVITLLGLRRYEQHIGPPPIPVAEVFEETLRNSASIEYAGDAGLLLWLTATMAPDRLADLYTRLDIVRKWSSYPDVKRGLTTELSWLLTGLCAAIKKDGRSLPAITDTAAAVFKKLRVNYGGRGIFGHLHSTSLTGAIRGNIGCFADQVYPIYALTKYFETHGNGEALAMGRRCSQTICELQGTFGQWWWHYDARTGRTVGRYPVFSVHQEGMAPMALFAASELTGDDFKTPIYKGLKWVLGKNELGVDMRDPGRNTIWRSIATPKWRRNVELLRAVMGNRVKETPPIGLELLFECRPYCFGWLLYAFSDKVATGPVPHQLLAGKEH